MKLFLTLAALVGFASAACPNSCSGHGVCDSHDSCKCFLESVMNETEYAGTIQVEWTGADCSRRTCPRGISWSMSSLGFRDGQPLSDDANIDLECSHQSERECSDQGLCDRATGICSCFPGYTGSSCQRTGCPDDCSGHGTCRSNKDFAYDWAIAKTTQLLDAGVATITEQFEQNYFASYNVAWDSGMHYGCLCDAGYRGPSCAMVECPSSTDPLDDKCAGEITDYQLQYDAPFGGIGWENAYSKRSGALNEQDDMDDSDANPNYVLDANGRKVYGCYGSMAGMDCSGRGICDYSSGTCKCFSGYAGTACEGVEELA